MAGRTRRYLTLVAAFVFLLPATAHATAGDLYAAGTAYQASTYRNHRSVFGGPEQWVADINANAGDAGRPIFAPEAGVVTILTTGWGDGYGNSIIWMSADGREQIHVAHLSAFAGTGWVPGGALIGYAGSTGNSTGDHMHVSRAYDGQPAPLVLSGDEIVPGYTGSGLQYTSGGPLPVAFRVSGVLEGMCYYRPVTVTFVCAGADAGTLAATIDGVPVSSGVAVATPGTHTLGLTAALGGSSCAKTLTFQVAAPPSPGLEPVFRFYNPACGTHFLTPSHDERDDVVERWPATFQYEGVAYFTNPAANAQPLFRFYNRASGSHFYTASTAERDMVIARWPDAYAYEGETYRVSPSPGPGAVTVFRFYNRANSSHFYTASIAERDMVIARWPDVYAYEGEAFWLGQ